MLVVAHSNTAIDVLQGLGVTTPVSIPDSEFDNFFVVVVAGERPTLVHLRYR